MKRVAYIFSSLVLSLMLLMSGAGLAFVDCAHDHGIFVAQLDLHHHHAHKHHHHICKETDHCAKVKIVRLSPSLQVQPAIALVLPVCTSLTPFMVAFLVPTSLWQPQNTLQRNIRDAFSSPPRHLLQLIRVLII